MSYGSDENQTVSRRTRVRRLLRRDGHLPFVPYGLLPALGLGLLTLFALWPFAQGIEHSTRRTVEQALAAEGIDWAKTSVSGQMVTLAGEASADEGRTAQRIAREALAATPFGLARPATVVKVKLTKPDASAAPPADTATPTEPAGSDAEAPGWQFSLANGILRLEGAVPDQATKDALLENARARIDPPRIVSVEDALSVSGDPLPAGYLLVALRGVNTVSQCDNGVSSLSEGRFSLRCELAAEDAAEVRAQAHAALPFGSIGSIDIITNEDVASCESSLTALLGDARIEFDSGSAVISSSSNGLLDKVAFAVGACPGTLRIEGHTDSTGLPDTNMTLSRNRAYAVRNALIARGVDPQRLIAEGYGATRPVAVNTTAAGRARNRRIEIRVVRASE
ncbi:MAG TPA: OmpA family protein [Hyphomonas sp.]|nr:OmpA family protein [Hyphomonas sp.]MCB9961838.1 OmpA family protein [Hyphomonas sp.]MCB9972667.1 OmpA family protein [Hyphomonas sp.]MCC0017570.1 OmpA family protein [Rhodobiaceae bacterium]HPE48119.1 OmpA family protein [Hyphomonas sp.]